MISVAFNTTDVYDPKNELGEAWVDTSYVKQTEQKPKIDWLDLLTHYESKMKPKS